MGSAAQEVSLALRSSPVESRSKTVDVGDFKSWFVDQMKSISPETNFILETQGPGKKNLRREKTVFSFYDFPKKPANNRDFNVQKFAQTHSILPEQIFTVSEADESFTTLVERKKRKQLDVRNMYFIVPGKVQDYSFQVKPELMSTVWQSQSGEERRTIIRTTFQIEKLDANVCYLKPLKTRMVSSNSIIKEIVYSEKQLERLQGSLQKEKKNIAEALERGEAVPMEKLSLEQQAQSGQKRIQESNAALGKSTKRIVDRSLQKKIGKRVISRAKRELSRSDECKTWEKELSKMKRSEAAMLRPDESVEVKFPWNEAIVSKLLKYDVASIHWNIQKPQSDNQWHVLNAEVTIEHCDPKRPSVILTIKQATVCDEAYCFEYDRSYFEAN